MKSVLLGFRGLNFSTQDGRVEGTQLFTAYPSPDVTGQETSKVFVRPELCPEGLENYIGSEINIEFNNKGKVVGVSL